MEGNKLKELEKRVAHLEATLEKLFKACYYTQDALNKSGEVWHFYKSKLR